MGFFNKLAKMFTSNESATNTYPSVEYKGYIITPQPESDKGQFRLAALIEKTFADDEQLKQHYLIRSDTFASAEQAAEFSIAKSKIFIDQTGDAMFK
jgi:hypothetical protein